MRTLLTLFVALFPPAAFAGPCPEREEVVFTCPVKTKVLAVCAGKPAGDLQFVQYRYGPPGAPELVYPKTAQGFSLFRLQNMAHMSGSSVSLSFVHEGTSFEVWSSDGPQGGAGVNLRKDGKVIGTVTCSGPYTERWSMLAGLVPEGSWEQVPTGKSAATCDAAARRYADWLLTQLKGQMDGVQQADVYEAVRQQCSAGWAADVVSCVAGSTSPTDCTARLTADQRAALLARVGEIVPE